jgi:arylsulfatase A-like enzyme
VTKRNLAITIVAIVALAGSLLVLRLMRRPSRSGGLEPPGSPNVVLLIIDTLRADYLGCYGCLEDVSPEIDEIAEDGVLFEDVTAQCSWTRPSIASMVTALYPRTLGIYKEEFDVLADEHVTLAEALKDQGYRTLGITANPNINKTFGFDQGFDEYSESTVIWSWMKPENGKIRQKPGKFASLPRSAEVFDWVLRRAASGDGRPTYVQINVMEVHSPDLARREFWPLASYYASRDAQRPDWNGPRKDIVWKTCMALRQVSHDTGVFIQRLKSLPGWGNTLFIITSDHGQGLDDHPDVYDSLKHGNLLYDSQVQVPLILYNPGDPKNIPGGLRIGARVRLLDIQPTVLDYARAPVSDRTAGRSLLPMMTGSGAAPTLPDLLVAETNWRDVDKIAVYSEDWMYIENRDGWKGVNEFELQRIGAPQNGRATDRINARPEIAERLRQAMAEWEERWKPAPAVEPVAGPSDEETDQLKSLGYIK